MALFCLGNPLLDISTSQDVPELLEKYDLKSNDAILASDSHASLFTAVAKASDVITTPGGAAQNTACIAAQVLSKFGAFKVYYSGAVGQDANAQQMESMNCTKGVTSLYCKTDHPTGVCCCLIHGQDRSLVTRLGAAEHYAPDFAQSKEIQRALSESNIIYITGFFLTHGIEVAKKVLNFAKDHDKHVVLNLSAVFILSFFFETVKDVLNYTDTVIGNEDEVREWARQAGFQDDIDVIGRELLDSTCCASLLMTRGKEPVLLIRKEPTKVVLSHHPAHIVSATEIKDTNGAGDAFVGGYLAYKLLHQSQSDAIEAGHQCAALCIRQNGAHLPENTDFKFTDTIRNSNGAPKSTVSS